MAVKMFTIILVFSSNFISHATKTAKLLISFIEYTGLNLIDVLTKFRHFSLSVGL